VTVVETLRQQRLYRLSDYIGRFVLEDPFSGTIEQDNMEAAVQDDEGVTGKIKNFEQQVGSAGVTVSQCGA
jgi:hypothetical protein